MVWIEVDDCWNCDGEGGEYFETDGEWIECVYCQGSGEA